ncbi:MAG: saccharopine dehydrogenase NADP-binding domain-containing protein [Oligoflexia bacterium]|nr:saccharopine dehydrogenase NADP-binding domain-containing protein [Oligoflexia bacterium]
MFTIALFGSGKIGETICALLCGSKRYKVKVCDSDLARAQAVAQKFPGAEAHTLNLGDSAASVKLLSGCNAVLSALPFHCNVQVAEYALKAGVHYFDLTEDVKTTDAVSKLAKGAKVAFMPQCGLAPGFISIAAAHLCREFQQIESVKMRVGALPVFPSNRLMYNLTWSTEGLINEYCNWCEAIENGERKLVPAMEGYERLSLDGCEYEAFNTSGGLGSLCDTLAGKVRSLDYKTIRYPGHCELIKFLLDDLRFTSDRESLKKIFERSLPTTKQDKCIIFVEVRGQKDGRFSQLTYASTVYNCLVAEQHFGAIQITTASGICAPLDLVLTGKLGSKGGIVQCEDITLPQFLDNEFGRPYRDDKAMSGLF